MRNDSHRHPRDDTRHDRPRNNGRDMLYGRQPVSETLLAGRRKVFSLSVAESVRASQDIDALLHAAARLHITVKRVDTASLDRATDSGHHQGVAAEVSDYPYVEFSELVEHTRSLKRHPLLLISDHLQDPQNLGAILRTAEGLGIDGVILPSHRSVGITPTVVRVSAGASEHMRIALVPNISQVIRELKEESFAIAGLEAVPEAVLCSQAELNQPLGLVIGSEGEGLARLVRENCDMLLRIPMTGKVGSLNAATAAAIALYEIHRQRK